MQSSPPFPPYPHPDDAPTVRLPRVAPPRSLLGSATFVVVLLGAVLAVFPATAAPGLLLCLLAIVPAVVVFLRSRKGRVRGNRQALAAMVMAPVFFVVAAVVLAATAPPPAKTPVPGTVAAASPAAEQAPESSAPATSAPAVAEQAVAPVVAPAPAVLPQPVVVPAAPQHVVAVPAAPRRVVAVPVVKPRPAPVPAPAPVAAPKPVPQPVVKTAPACNEATHYVNSSGNCVLRPVAAASAPAGATAKCGDGTYSSSQHRQGTCSKHGGVATWLVALAG